MGRLWWRDAEMGEKVKKKKNDEWEWDDELKMDSDTGWKHLNKTDFNVGAAQPLRPIQNYWELGMKNEDIPLENFAKALI